MFHGTPGFGCVPKSSQNVIADTGVTVHVPPHQQGLRYMKNAIPTEYVQRRTRKQESRYLWEHIHQTKWQQIYEGGINNDLPPEIEKPIHCDTNAEEGWNWQVITPR